MTVWDDLGTEIVRLRDARPTPLSGYPDPRGDEQALPVQINLAAWASDEAAQLHRRFGDDVRLTVGAMSYPAAQDLPLFEEPADDASPDEVTFDLAEPLTIRSGHSETTQLLVTNHTDTDIVLTTGQLTGIVTDPDTGHPVGTAAGFMTLQLITRGIEPAATVAIPLRIGTASRVAALGHAIPPGQWTLHTTVGVGGRRLRTPPFPLTIT